MLPLLVSLYSYGQIIVVPSTNSCSCNGSATFDNGNSNALTFNLTDNSGSVISSGASANGIINMSGLCSVAFLLEITQGGVPSTYVFNVPVNGTDPGDAIAEGICDTDIAQNFNTLIPGLVPGGQWTNPNNQVQIFHGLQRILSMVGIRIPSMLLDATSPLGFMSPPFKMLIPATPQPI
ncbi:MAG: hypothetical protein IPP69_13125 [Flavobacteriales bacterium]|nr:hypothetical protein [Flavobacteriales bacterium]